MELLKTLRTPKIFNIAIFDLSATLLFAYYLAVRFNGNKIYYMVGALLLGIFVHWIFGINTMLNYYLGLSDVPT